VQSKDDRLVGITYFTDRGEGSVEIAYGVAPAHRGQGIATRAAGLAAAWLLREAGWHRVELRIADDAAASKRVAAKAGFTTAGRIRTRAQSGEEFEDCLYLMTPETLPPDRVKTA
jgi:ribosomal-protein-alanine N-acetyltransferase